MKTKAELAKLTADLKVAYAAAVEKTQGPDGGTCCLDYPGIKLPRTKAVFEAIRAAGFDPSHAYGSLRGYIRLGGFPGMRFQGWNRTTGADTVADTLAGMGYTTGVYYAID